MGPKLNLKTAPSVEPVTAADLAAWLGASASDPLLPSLSASARDMVESYLGAGIIDQTWQQFYDLNCAAEGWWDGIKEGPTTEIVKLPRFFAFQKWPVKSVAVTFYDEADAASIAAPASYYLDPYARPTAVVLRDGYDWPSVVYRVSNAAMIEAVVGYGAAAANVPEAIKNAIKSAAAYMFEHRGACDVNEVIRNSGAADFLRPYKALHV